MILEWKLYNNFRSKASNYNKENVALWDIEKLKLKERNGSNRGLNVKNINVKKWKILTSKMTFHARKSKGSKRWNDNNVENNESDQHQKFFRIRTYKEHVDINDAGFSVGGRSGSASLANLRLSIYFGIVGHCTSFRTTLTSFFPRTKIII